MKKNARRFWMVTAICGGTALLFMLLSALGSDFESLQRLEFFTQDKRMVRGVKTPVDPRLVLIGIDQASYVFSDAELQADPNLQLMQQNYPWGRTVWAEIITKLADAGAKVIVLDLVFGAESDSDSQLRAVLDKYKDHVVIGSNLRDLHSVRGNSLTIDRPNPSLLNYTNADFPDADDRVGYVNIWPERDGVLRKGQYRLIGGKDVDVVAAGAVLQSLDTRALQKFGRAELIPAGSDPVRFRYTDRAGLGYPANSLGDIMIPKIWQKNFQNGEFFRDKIVFIGPTADIFQDAHRTPFPNTSIGSQDSSYSSSMAGPEIHLNLIGAALHGAFLRDCNIYERLLIILVAGLFASLLSFAVRQPVKRLLGLVILGVIYWEFGQWLFDHASLVVPEASPLLVLGSSGVFVLSYDWFVEQYERTRVRRTLERYVSKNVVRELLDNQATYFHTLEGVRKPVTVMFSDLRGFTQLTESSDSKKLVAQLNEYLEEMTRHVFVYKGTLDKFIGDAVMAVWGNIVTQGPEQDAQSAVAAALAMKAGLVKLNASWRQRGMQELSFGIGINHGEAIVGNLGSTEKMDLTVIGDAVNAASRLEGLTKRFHVEVLLGQAVAPLVQERFILRSVGLILFKGKSKPMEVFTVIGEHGRDIDAKTQTWLAEYEGAVTLYRQREFAEAQAMFEKCLREVPDDFLCDMYRHECETLKKTPPPENWNGVFVMLEK